MGDTKKILFVVPNLKIGGITTAFLNLLNEIKDFNFTIDVLSFDDDDLELLPSFVNAVPTNKFMRMLTVSQSVINKQSKVLGFIRLALGAVAKFFGQRFVYPIVFSTYKKLKGYDVAISYAQSANRSLYGGCNEFVLKKTDAYKKIAFLHCDYQRVGINTAYSKWIYKQFDKIAAVSYGVKKAFVEACPDMETKTDVVYNCYQYESIRRMANENTMQYDSSVLNFVTVARIAPEKGHLRMLEVFKKLKAEGCDFCWHVVGGGCCEADFAKMIEQGGMGECVKLYGEQTNPYRFIKGADYLLVPSFHEAAPMVYAEALSLGVPVVTTNTLSAQEFIGENEFGVVCGNTLSDIYSCIKFLIEFPSSVSRFKFNIDNNYNYSNVVFEQQFKLIISD